MQCIASKDSMLYCIDTLRSGTEEALDILADAVLNPKFPEEEINQSKMMVAFQDENIHPGLITKDLVNISAYRGYPLGNRHLCPLDIVEGFTAQKLIDFRKEHLFGDNCVLAASGADHDTLVKIATEKFGSLPKGKKNASPESKFVGGLITNERKMKEPFTKVAMAFEVGGWNSDLVIPVCVAQQLLGGGSSFSAGGPGKGMYSRLYTRVLNKFYWAESIEAFVSLYDKNGLFGIDGACPPENVANMIKAIMDELTDLAYIKVSDIPLTRAKNMLKSMMMMQLESRLVVCEDIARQLLTYGFRESPTIICEKIDKITADDIMRVGKKLLESPPAVAIAGESITDDPSYEDIESYVKLYRDQCEERYK